MRTLKPLLIGSLAATAMAASLCAFGASDDSMETVSTTNSHITYKINLGAGESKSFELPNVKGLPVHLMATLVLNFGDTIPGSSSQIQAVVSYDNSAKHMVWLGQNSDGSATGDSITPPLLGYFGAGYFGSITAIDTFDSPGGKKLTITGGSGCSTCTFFITMDY